jgi:hypothetical protein
LTLAQNAQVAGHVAADVTGVGSAFQVNFALVGINVRVQRIDQATGTDRDDGHTNPVHEPVRRLPHKKLSFDADE